VQLGKTTTAIAVYNFEVEGKHTYFVIGRVINGQTIIGTFFLLGVLLAAV